MEDLIMRDLRSEILSIKEKLEKSNILLEKDMLFQFDNDKWGMEANKLKKFLEYKDTKGYYGYVDCDVTLAATVVYTLMNKAIPIDSIRKQGRSNIKYEIFLSGNRYKGDTLTSALTLLRGYLKIFKGINNASIKYCRDNVDRIWNEMEEEVKSFFSSYMKVGNYICIPGESYEGRTSFNTARSNFGKCDTIDTLLWRLYQYYQTSDTVYLEKIFTNKNTDLVDETVKWLQVMGFANWQDFIEVQCLEDFVSEKDLVPISMKTGEKIHVPIGDDYYAFPQTHDELLKFFKENSNRINLRTIRINDKLHKKFYDDKANL